MSRTMTTKKNTYAIREHEIVCVETGKTIATFVALILAQRQEVIHDKQVTLYCLQITRRGMPDINITVSKSRFKSCSWVDGKGGVRCVVVSSYAEFIRSVEYLSSSLTTHSCTRLETCHE